MATQQSYSVIEEFLSPVLAALTPEVAERLLDYRLSPQFEAHINELAEKANEGTLSEKEREEYAQIVEAIDLVSIFKLKVKSALGR
jgi:hypothetical protein